MKKFRNLVASAATVMLMVSPMVATPAVARDNSRVWNVSPADAQASLQAGMRTCFGDAKKKMQSVCSVYDPVNRLMTTLVTLRGDGVIKNLSTVIISPTDEIGNVLRDEAGRPIVLAAHVAEQMGGKAILGQGLAAIPGAFFNGMGAAGINAAFPACGNNCGGGGPQVINLLSAVSGSNANAGAAVDVALGGNNGTCPTGSCPSKPSGH